MKEILDEMHTHLIDNVDDYLPFPKPFTGKNKVKAIVVGADPSTNKKIRFDTVFNLGGDDNRYFNGIKKNLNAIGLSIDDVYVQNFCQNYFTKTTYKQRKNWYKAAGICYYYFRKEVNQKFDQSIPLLVTSEIIFKRLTQGDPTKAKTYYENPSKVPVPAPMLMSERLAFPFYRHWRYNLEHPEWEAYRNKLKDYFSA